MAGGFYSPSPTNILTSANWKAFVRDQTVNQFATSAARSSAITSPTEGMVSVLLDSDRLDFYDGSAWQLIGFVPGVLLARKTSDQSFNLTTVLQNDTELLASVAINAVYEGHIHLFYNSPTAADFKMDLSVPAGASAVGWSFAGVNAASAVAISAASAGVTVSGLGGTAADQTVDLFGLLITGGTAGTAQVRWAQDTGNATNTTVKATSYMSLRRIT